MTICPTCGHSMNAGRAPIEALSGAPLGRLERLIVNVLVRAYPRAISRQIIVDYIYGDDPNGGPDNPDNIVSVLMVKLRRKLPQYGWTIPNNRNGSGNYGRYRLEPLP